MSTLYSVTDLFICRTRLCHIYCPGSFPARLSSSVTSATTAGSACSGSSMPSSSARQVQDLQKMSPSLSRTPAQRGRKKVASVVQRPVAFLAAAESELDQRLRRGVEASEAAAPLLLAAGDAVPDADLGPPVAPDLSIGLVFVEVVHGLHPPRHDRQLLAVRVRQRAATGRTALSPGRAPPARREAQELRENPGAREGGGMLSCSPCCRGCCCSPPQLPAPGGAPAELDPKFLFLIQGRDRFRAGRGWPTGRGGP